MCIRDRCKSAFTYCEDDLPSRTDFGKTKYGGPFTTEQMEDVKTFLRLLPFILAGSVMAGVILPTLSLWQALRQQYTLSDESNMKHS